MTTLLASILLGAAPATVNGAVTLANDKAAAHAVVWLDGDAKSSPLKRAVVDQRNRSFIPHISVVTVGTQIQFPNNDTVFHNVFAAFDAKKFDLGLYPRGKTKVQSFNKPGLVALMCSIHSEMSAFVMVVDTPYYAVADAKGKFKISGVQPGTYTLRTWHETGQIAEQPIKVSGDQSFDLRTAMK